MSFEFAKIYIRSIVGIVSMSVCIGYGMSLGSIDSDVLLAYLAACTGMVLFDKGVATL